MGKMHEICMNCCNFTKKLLKSKILPINFEDGGTQECTVKPFFVLADGLRLFAMRLPSLSQGMECGDCGITFDIFTHVLAWVCVFFFVYFIYNYFPETKKSFYNEDTFTFTKYTDSV